MENFSPAPESSIDNIPEAGEITEPIEITVSFWKKPVVSFLLELIQTLILAAILYFMIDFVIARVRVENISMKPTLQPGEFLLVNKMAYKLGEMKRGDIVIFHHTAEEDYIKRLIGLPGDLVEIRNKVVKVNEKVLDEPYIAALPSYNGKWVVPEGSIFVLGDNRNQSSDSHSWGFVPREKVIGKALAIYWPIENAQVLTHPDIVKASNNN
ncbi:MAG: signal peptidase I [Leptolinea sp.]|nr:signal peptidase I [Leptolinea sp.]